MSEIPKKVTESNLWKRLAQSNDLENAMKNLRARVEVLAAKIAEHQPGLTDHSIIHLDALWDVANHILLAEEMELVTAGEAFVLGGAFYLHDIGMAIGAAPDGQAVLQQSEAYKAEKIRLQAFGMEPEKAKTQSMRYAARADHARFAIELAQGKIPGSDQYLLENSTVREHWGETIGQISASHHWSINDLKRRLGDREVVPDATGKENDLGYVACLLRIIDYAHINMDRASVFERLLRPHLPIGSVVHWDAQQNIAGPIRKNNLLIYSSTKQIESVDGWWTFYEMARGLDMEISSVREYLVERAASKKRFSLEGVKGVKFPQDFSRYVLTKDFEPVDIRFRPDSMERLVELLGGKMLYGNDASAPIRELLQNARDAIELYRAQSANPETLEPPSIRISIVDDAQGRFLEVSDNGIGMSEHVVTNYLLGIASDYWHSSDFYSEHGKGLNREFNPVGRFGIGFLSVFMLGNSVEVKTQRRNGPMLVLNLHGVGQRGTLKKIEGCFVPGTTVRVRISEENYLKYSGLTELVRSKAPMLHIPIIVSELGKEFNITPGWWKKIKQAELFEFLADGFEQKYSGAEFVHLHRIGRPLSKRMRGESDAAEQWLGEAPEVVTEQARIIAIPNSSGVLICSKGFLVSSRSVNGMTGLINVEELELTAARTQILEWDDKSFWQLWSRELDTHLINALNRLDSELDIPARYNFLVRVGKTYRLGLLTECALRWMAVRLAPGELKLFSPASFTDYVKSEHKVLISYGASVWFGESLVRRIFDCAETVPVTLTSSASQPDVGSYDDGKAAISGDIEEHFSSTKYSAGEPDDAVLLMATLEIIAHAWGCSTDSLVCTWKRQERALFGKIERPKK